MLVLTPATVSFPVALEELLVLAGGLALMLAIDVALLRRALRRLRRWRRSRAASTRSPRGSARELGAADPEVRDVAAAVDEMLDRLEAERRESARRALAAQEDERVRIARELHDEVGQALTAVMWMVDGDARDAVRGDAARTSGRSPGGCGPRRSTTSACSPPSPRSPPRRSRAAGCGSRARSTATPPPPSGRTRNSSSTASPRRR